MGFLDIRNVTKSYGRCRSCTSVDIAVEEGEFLVLVGPSGCGKSTLLNMIAGLEAISGGEIAIKGRVVNGVHPSKRNIAMVFQTYALYPNMTVGQNMTFGLEMHGVPKPERDKALAEVGEAAADRPPAGPQAGAAVGRAAPAGRDGAGAGAEPGRVPVRRTAVEPRRQAARRHADRDQEAAPEAEDHHRLRHPRPDRGDDPVHPDRGDEQGPCPAAGHAEGDLRHARRTCSWRPSWAARR